MNLTTGRYGGLYQWLWLTSWNWLSNQKVLIDWQKLIRDSDWLARTGSEINESGRLAEIDSWTSESDWLAETDSWINDSDWLLEIDSWTNGWIRVDTDWDDSESETRDAELKLRNFVRCRFWRRRFPIIVHARQWLKPPHFWDGFV